MEHAHVLMLRVMYSMFSAMCSMFHVMHLTKITDKDKLNDFIASQKNSEFLQSWEWGKFQKKMGNEIFRLGVLNDDELIGLVTLIKKPLPLGQSYFYAPRGPLLNYELPITNYELVFDFLLGEICEFAKEKKIIFFRFEPDARFKIQDSKFKIKKTTDIQPSQTIVIDLTKSEEDLLKNMHSKTRYNIRLADKKGVEIIEARLDKFDEFWNLINKTSARDGFRLHSKDHYKTMLQESNNRLFFAKYNNQVIAAAIINFFGNTVTYLHGASSNQYRNIMAPYLLQWHIIKLAKKSNYKYYDFYGINETKWPGVTRFKKGFNGKTRNYPGTFNLIINKKIYFTYQVIHRIKHKIMQIIK